MKRLLSGILSGRIISPWWILLIDMLLISNSFVLASVLELNQYIITLPALALVKSSILVFLVYFLVFVVTKSYRGVIRHTGYEEIKTLSKACLVGFFILMALSFMGSIFQVPTLYIPYVTLTIHLFFSLFLCFIFRMVVKETYSYLTRKSDLVNAYIFGAGELGLITLEAIKSDKAILYNIVGFIDDDPSKWSLNLAALPVMSWEKALHNSDLKNVELIILAKTDVPIERKQEISRECTIRNWKLKVMPSVGNWVNGVSNNNQIRDVRIDDLLGRDEIKLNQLQIMQGLVGKVILVTGAAGSIGSEIVRQLLKFPVKKIVLLDNAESDLYNLQQELILSYCDAPFDLVLADVTNRARIKAVFEQYIPHIVFNAAAYKHVPMLEMNPYEGIRVNIGGVKILADLSIEYGVEKFVMVSTDKAVNPTNVMGATKRICELYIQSLSQLKTVKTSFITTRFGNVLGSNGSVVPLFKKQIEQGGPLTVTHPDITRYFMTIPEACQLVLEAGFMGQGGEIFVFDMGEPVKIDFLAREMVRLAGLIPDVDIPIKYTGLRPGEKLYEELLANKEDTLPTYHDKILIAKVHTPSYFEVNSAVNDLLFALQYDSDVSLVEKMKDLVPEYISSNSHFVVIDGVRRSAMA
ncbi:MAG: polysaccharide biosynthesis protein [Breznakibacter sp.]